MQLNQPQTQICDLLHRLQSLEVDLHEALRAREISEGEYSSRLDRLRNALNHADKIKNLMNPLKIETKLASQIDLPVLVDYSRLEQKIVVKFVSDMKSKVMEVNRLTQMVLDFTQQAMCQTTGLFRSIWRLSWLRRQLIKADADIAKVRKARTLVEEFITKSEIGSGSEPKAAGRDDLMSAFKEFNRVMERVTLLRATVRSESSKNEAMKSWLKSVEIERRSKSPEKPVPELRDVMDVASSINQRIFGGADLAKHRLVIARQVLGEAKKDASESRLSAEPVNELSFFHAEQRQMIAKAETRRYKKGRRGARP